MAFFFRKRVGFGPFRLNFSKSGIGASVGVRGARLTMTPRGTTYVTVGSHGFYYRETLSHGLRSPAPSPVQPIAVPVESRPSDEIVTADVADLVDSSSETLINRLNERARMFNPAWLMYVVAAAVAIAGLIMISTAPDLPDVSLPFTFERKTNPTDEYSVLVARYGEPNHILSTTPLRIVPVWTVDYSNAHARVVLVPIGCVEAYEDATRNTTPTNSKTPCTAAANAGWTIVGYIDALENRAISAEMAKSLLDGITAKQSSPAVLEVGSDPPKKERSSRRPAKKQPTPSSLNAQFSQQALLSEERTKQKAEGAEARALYSRVALLIGSLGLFVAGVLVHQRNTEKRTSRLFYELDDTEGQKYGVVQQGVTGHLAQSHRIWRIEAESGTSDWKRNAGASSLVRRALVTVGYSNPQRVQSNMAIPSINLGRVKLFFLPDLILYWEMGTYGGIAYRDFRVEQGVTRFIEDGQVPADATIVDRTWRYVNRDGGPDRRFNNNVQLPVLQLGVLVFTSSRGLNIHLNTSNVERSLAFANCWRTLQERISGVQGQQTQRVSTPQPKADSVGPKAQARKVLGVSETASDVEISAAHRRLAQMYHPDKVSGLAPEFQALADKRMREINAAYDALKQHPEPE